ncbi:MAG TPA: beta-L-arabinofuranosidase domain-containing protein [Bryobacteraceae bacterium]|nr:beta-L-arabinofuranosidase domain-containing protein [Bryobacteraceae bacterium]
MTSRRQFLQVAAAACAKAGAGPRPALLSTFDYAQVELLASPLRRQLDTNHSFFLNLSEDRMLKIYRQRVGLPAPGPDMGGWYDDFCPGAHFGQYMSALARFARITDSGATRAKVGRLVRGFAETLDPAGKFFVDHRYPGYTYDKLVLGLLDAHFCAGDPTALDVLAKMTRVALPHMAGHAMTAEEMHARPHKDETYTWDETYTFAENLFLAFEKTGDRQYFDLGKGYLLDRGFFDPLAEGQNVLPGLHAYSHVNALSSGIQGYLKLDNPKYLRAVKNATEMILKDQSYATGGWGPNESFVEPGKGELGASLRESHRHFESGCGSYSHFKLMRYLLSITQDARYGDSMERVLYNCALGILPILEDGSTFYYSDYHPSTRKSYLRIIPDAAYRWDLDDRWPCCSGTFPQLTADYGISSYLEAPDGVYVILYVPSRLKWKHGTIEQQTDYPASSQVTLHVTAPRAADFTVYLRIPAWTGSGAAVSVNGRRERAALTPGFYPLRKRWKTGDRIELELPQSERLEPVDAQTPAQVAVVRGPQVWFALADHQPKLPRRQLASARIEKAGDDYVARCEPGDIRVRPFGGIKDELYQTYWEVTD